MTSKHSLFSPDPDELIKGKVFEIDLDLEKYFLNTNVDVTGSWQEPLFSAIDVAKEIDDLAHYKRTIATHLRKDVDYVELELTGRIKSKYYFTENGLYRYLMKSERPDAVSFQDKIAAMIKQMRLGAYVKLKDKALDVAFEYKLLHDKHARLTRSYQKQAEDHDWLVERNRLVERGYHTVYKPIQEHTYRDFLEHYLNVFIFEYKYKMRDEPDKKNRYLPRSFTRDDIGDDIVNALRRDAQLCFVSKNDEGIWESVCAALDKFLVKDLHA